MRPRCRTGYIRGKGLDEFNRTPCALPHVSRNLFKRTILRRIDQFAPSSGAGPRSIGANVSILARTGFPLALKQDFLAVPVDRPRTSQFPAFRRYVRWPMTGRASLVSRKSVYQGLALSEWRVIRPSSTSTRCRPSVKVELADPAAFELTRSRGGRYACRVTGH